MAVKKINSLDLSVKALPVVLGLTVLLPGVLTLALRVWPAGPLKLIRALSLGAGLALLALLGVIWSIEFLQDRFLARYWARHRCAAERLSGGGFECRRCGFRSARVVKNRCPACHAQLESAEVRPRRWFLK